MVAKKFFLPKIILTSFLQTFFATLLLFLFLEAAFFLLGFPRGASSHAEAIIIREGLTAKKPPGEFRIFAYGESTMNGSHYREFSNPAVWLGAYLRDLLPHKKIRIVNFARMGQSIPYTYQNMTQTMDYHPDLVLVYSGHNLFLPGNRKNQLEAKLKSSKYFWRTLIYQSRFISFVYRLSLKIKMARNQGRDPDEDSIEYRVIEVGPGGIGEENAVPNNTPAYAENIDFFKEYLFNTIRELEKRKLPAIFLLPVGNLKDFSPFMSVHMKALEEKDLKQWNDWCEAGRAAISQGRREEAIQAWSEAYAMDPTYAELDFNLAGLYFAKGELEKAKALFEAARDYDAIKVRAPKEVLQIYQNLATEGRIHLLPTDKLLSPEAPGGILGEPIIEDNVHFSIKGHAIVGKALAEEIARQGWIAPQAEWRFDRLRSFEEMYRDFGVKKELIINAYLSMVHYFGRRYDNRLRFAERALELAPENPRGLRHLAWSYWLKGDRNEALDAYKRLQKVHPEALEEVFKLQPEVQKAFEKSFPAPPVLKTGKAA